MKSWEELVSTKRSRLISQQARTYRGFWGSRHLPFSSKGKITLFLLMRFSYNHHQKFESNEITKIPVIFLPFLHLRNIIPSCILIDFLVYSFLCIRFLPSKIQSFLLVQYSQISISALLE